MRMRRVSPKSVALLPARRPTKACSGRAISMSLMQGSSLAAVCARRLPEGEDITSSLEEKLDAYIRTRKEERKDALLGDSLPLPMRFPKSGIEGMRLTSRGFVFYASFDNHQFIIGKSSLLQGALKAGAYIT